MDAPDPPQAPDPVATANAQAAANVQTAIANTALGNANVNGPTGSTRFDVTGHQTVTDVSGSQTGNTFGQTAGQIQYGLNTQDLNTARDSATNAALQRLQPSMNQDDATLASTLAGQGIQQGSAAWNAAMQSRSAAKNDLYLGAVQTGDAEQQAGFNQALASGNFNNAAQQQDYNQLLGRAQFGLSADQSNNAANLAAGNFTNNALATQGNFFNNAQATQGNYYNSAQAAQGAFANSAQAQGNSQNQAAAGFANSAALQQYQAEAAAREMPLNEISALMSGGQVTMPQFNGYQGGTVGQTPYSQDVYASANLDEQNYQAQLQQQSSMMSGLFGLGSKAFGLFGMSDRRLKRNVVRLGQMPNGLALYAWDYLWGGPREVGHMADEVLAVAPEAVAVHPSGFLMVDYARV